MPKAKAPAKPVPQTREEVQQWIANLGNVQRDTERNKTAMNERIAQVTQEYATLLDTLATRENDLLDGIAAWCEANKADLTKDGRTINLVTGEVAWRVNPPSVAFKRGIKVEEIVAHIKQLKLAKLFIRVKEEVNKDAILSADDKTRARLTAAGTIKIVTDAETFSVTPFEQDAP